MIAIPKPEVLPCYYLVLFDRETQVCRRKKQDHPWPVGDFDHDAGQYYYYGEGNYSCDCNRGPAFLRDGESDDGPNPCNRTENRFLILWIEAEDGRKLLDQTEWLNPDNDPAELAAILATNPTPEPDQC